MTGVSTLGQALRQIENISSQQILFSQLSTQMATGKKTQSYAGLNTDALTSLRSRTQLSNIEIFKNNMTRADTRIGLMLTSVEEFQAQSREFSKTQTTMVIQGPHQQGEEVYYDDPLTSVVETTIVGRTSALPDNDLKSVMDHASNLYNFLVDLVNTQDGDRYVLAGADSLVKPVNDQGTLDAAITSLISDWKAGTITTDDLIRDLKDRTSTGGNPDALTDTIVGFSPSLTSGNSGDVFIRVSEETEFKYTALANESGFRDVLVALAFLKSDDLGPIEDVYPDGVYPGVPTEIGAPGANSAEKQENFYKVYKELTTMVSQAIDQIDEIRFRLETVRAQMDQTQKSHQNQKTLLLNTITGVEDVDTNEVAVKLTTLKTQLEASYQVTALTAGLSLINFI
jgi:flagellar hook-associated protein 3 FlgL